MAWEPGTTAVTMPSEPPETAPAAEALPSRRRLLMVALAILLLAAGVRIWLAGRMEVISKDGIRYIGIARAWSDDPSRVIREEDYHLGYPVVVAAVQRVYRLAGGAEGRLGWERAAVAVSIVSSLAAILAVWLLAALAFDWRVAHVAALLFAMAKKWAYDGADVLSDPLAVALQLWAIVLALLTVGALRRFEKRALLRAAGVGLCAGAGYLVRPEALLTVVLAVVLWLATQWRRPRSLRLAAGSAAVALAVAAACALPYMLAIGGLTRKKAIDEIVRAPAGGLLAMVTPLAASWVAGADKFIEQLFEAMHPIPGFLVLAWMALVVSRASSEFWGIRMRRRWALPWLRWLPPRRRLRPARGPAFFMAAVTAVMALVLVRMFVHVEYISHRHLFLTGALLTPLAGAAVVAAMDVVRALAAKLRLPDPVGPAVAGLLPALLVCGLAYHVWEGRGEDKGHFRRAGEALLAGGDGGAVLSDSPWVPYYAERRGLVQTAPERLAARLERPDPSVGYVALSERTLRGEPRLYRLLGGPRFEGVGRFPNGLAGRHADAMRVYRVRPAPE